MHDIYVEFINPLRLALGLEKIPYTEPAKPEPPEAWLPDVSAYPASFFYCGADTVFPINNRRMFKRQSLVMQR